MIWVRRTLLLQSNLKFLAFRKKSLYFYVYSCKEGTCIQDHWTLAQALPHGPWLQQTEPQHFHVLKEKVKFGFKIRQRWTPSGTRVLINKPFPQTIALPLSIQPRLKHFQINFSANIKQQARVRSFYLFICSVSYLGTCSNFP